MSKGRWLVPTVTKESRIAMEEEYNKTMEELKDKGIDFLKDYHEELLALHFNCNVEDIIELKENVYEVLGHRYVVGNDTQINTYITESKKLKEQEEDDIEDCKNFLENNYQTICEDASEDSNKITDRIKLEENFFALMIE